MIVVKNARFVTDNKMVKCTMDYYVLLNGVPENSPRVAIGEARCAPGDEFVFQEGMNLAYGRAYEKAIEAARKINFPDMRFVCVKSGSDFKSGTIYPVHYNFNGNPYVLDDAGNRRPTTFYHTTMSAFLGFMKANHMIKLED